MLKHVPTQRRAEICRAEMHQLEPRYIELLAVGKSWRCPVLCVILGDEGDQRCRQRAVKAAETLHMRPRPCDLETPPIR